MIRSFIVGGWIGGAVSKKEEAVLLAAEAWAAARAEVYGMTEREAVASDGVGSAELAMHSAAERVDALRAAELALYEAVRAKVAPRSVPVAQSTTGAAANHARGRRFG